MKAIVYGPSSTLELAEIEKPAPADDEVLLRVRAASVNPLDCHMLETAPLVRGLMFKMIGVKVKRPGVDVAGEVEAVGRNVTRFAPGDAVFGASPAGLSPSMHVLPSLDWLKNPPTSILNRLHASTSPGSLRCRVFAISPVLSLVRRFS